MHRTLRRFPLTTGTSHVALWTDSQFAHFPLLSEGLEDDRRRKTQAVTYLLVSYHHKGRNFVANVPVAGVGRCALRSGRPAAIQQ